MAVDVLSYNALNCRTQLDSDKVSAYTSGRFFRNPADTTLWNSNLPMCITSGTVLNVCDTSGNFRCGVCCLWTVPAGVTRAQFQLWGAGAINGGAACCGGSLPGSTGAYAIVTIPVVAGCQYTLCAGCAFCCYAGVTTGNAEGCASFVTGFGLSNFCAEGGRGGMCALNCIYGSSKWSLLSIPNTYSNDLNFTTNSCMSCFCLCSTGSSYCTSGSSYPLSIPILRSDRTFYGNTTTSGVNVCGLPSMFAGACRDANHYGFNLIPPVVTPCCATAHVVDTAFTGAVCCQVVSASTLGGVTCAALCTSGCFKWPGQGAVGVHVMGGTCTCGDAGRMGMVKVTYC